MKNQNGMAFLRHIYFYDAKISLRQFWAYFGKNAVSHSWQSYTMTQDNYNLRKAAHVFVGWWGVGGRTSICGMAKD